MIDAVSGIMGIRSTSCSAASASGIDDTVAGGPRRSLPRRVCDARLAEFTVGGRLANPQQAVSNPVAEQRDQWHVHAQVALALLEAVRNRDRPGEVLDDENVSVTLPRRFGLSDVVEAQIRRYREEARKGHRISEAEARDLIRLVSRRPDASRVLDEVGRSLTAADGAPRWRRVLPDRIAMDMARRRIRRRLRSLFGGRLVRAPRGDFRLEAAHGLLVEADPNGTACALVTGLSQAVVDAYRSRKAEVAHVTCIARGDERCRWEIADSTTAQDTNGNSRPGQRQNGDGGSP